MLQLHVTCDQGQLQHHERWLAARDAWKSSCEKNKASVALSVMADNKQSERLDVDVCLFDGTTSIFCEFEPSRKELSSLLQHVQQRTWNKIAWDKISPFLERALAAITEKHKKTNEEPEKHDEGWVLA